MVAFVVATVELLAPRLGIGRVYTSQRTVRLGDVDASGRLRMDALARYTQDVSDEDTTTAGLPVTPGWVVRANTIDEVHPAGFAEKLSFITYCSGTGSRWAERRLSISGSNGARYELATIWVCVDLDSGRPQKLTDHFLELYGEAAGGRVASAKLTHPKPADIDPGELAVDSWWVRKADLDIFKHVNNAAYWAVVEEFAPTWTAARRFKIEYGSGIDRTGPLAIASAYREGAHHWWWLPDAKTDDGSIGAATPDELGSPAASARMMDLPPDLYRDAHLLDEQSPAET